MKRNVAVISGICLVTCLVAFSCASAPPVEGLVGLDEAMEQAAAVIEAKAVAGSGIVVAVITSPSTQTGNFLAEELITRISMRGNLIALVRGTALASVDKEQRFQMSGQVSDASAVGIGHFLGAKTVITGTFDRYAGFSQLRLRAVDVETSALTASFTARIRNNDPVLVNLGGSLQGTEDASVGDQALAHLNRGKDQLAVKAWDAAIGEFDRALAIDRKLAAAYLYRGEALYGLDQPDAALADYNQAIALNANYAEAYAIRGGWYANLITIPGSFDKVKKDLDNAIADYTRAIRLAPDYEYPYWGRSQAYYLGYLASIWNVKNDPRFSDIKSLCIRGFFNDYDQLIRLNSGNYGLYVTRGEMNNNLGYWDRAIADYTEAIRLKPDEASLYMDRGNSYARKGDWDLAIADCNQAIMLDPDSNNNRYVYTDRGDAYAGKGDWDRAMADYNQAIMLDPKYNGSAYSGRGDVYTQLRDWDRAIADYETALRIWPDYDKAKAGLEKARRRGR